MDNCTHCGIELQNKKNKFCSLSCNAQFQAINRNYSNYGKRYKILKEQNILKYLTNPTKCNYCGIILNYEKRKNSFCSRSCAATVTNSTRGPRSEQTKKLISKTNKKRHKENVISEEEKIKRKESSIKIGKLLSLRAELKLLAEDFNTLSFERLRKRVILEQEKKCNICQNSEWLNRPLVFELNHIDGDNKNNLRNNLEALCPNCHSTTDTWRGRNKKNQGFIGKRVSDEDLILALISNNWNTRQALLEVGLAAKGGNYPRCAALKKKYLEFNNIESFSNEQINS